MSKIKITKGDKARLNVRVKLNGEYLNLDGYTFESYYLKENGDYLTVEDSAHEPVADQDDDANTGKMIITIPAEDTADLKAGPNFDLIIKVTNEDDEPLHYEGKNMLKVKSNRPTA